MGQLTLVTQPAVQCIVSMLNDQRMELANTLCIT